MSALVAGVSASTGQIFMGIMLKPISEELGWSRSLTAGAITLGTIAGGVLAPPAGALADRFGARYLTPLAAIAVVMGFFVLAGMDQVWQLYLGYAVMRGIGTGFLSGVTPMTSMVNWFRRRRGRAMGMISMSFPLGGATAVLVGQLIIEAAGWRAAFIVFGLALATVGILPPALLIRRRPEDVGLTPDGAPRPAAAPDAVAPPAAATFPLRAALRTSTFWLMAFSMFSSTLAGGALAFHMPAFLTDRGLAPAVGAAAIGSFALFGAISSGLWGFLSERISERVLAVSAMSFAAVVTVLIAQVRVEVLAVPLAAALGFAARGEGALLNIMVARYFGRRSYGRVAGALQPATMVALGTGPLLASLSFDALGSYELVFLVAVGLYVSGALLISQARPPVR